MDRPSSQYESDINLKFFFEFLPYDQKIESCLRQISLSNQKIESCLRQINDVKSLPSATSPFFSLSLGFEW
jgi:hypothetical protein